MKKNRFSHSTKAVILITALLLVVNIVIGSVIALRSRASIRKLINSHMLGVSKTASAMLDGDTIANMTEADVGTETYQDILDELRLFAKNFDFEYIYIVRPNGNTYEFVVDADPDDPADFGEKIVYSPALGSAGAGEAAVDTVAVGDEWGKFYTAYCPIMTSDGKVGGIVGIDFDAEWYESQLTQSTAGIIMASAISLIIGGALVLLVTMKLKEKLDYLNEETNSIAADVGTLLNEINSEAGYAKEEDDERQQTGDAPQRSKEEGGIEKLSKDVKAIRENLKRYIDYVHIKAYTDGMTGVGNKTAYLELVHDINDRINDENLSFSIAVFDVDNLKLVNDEHGHEMGDNLINGTAACIKNVFGAKNVYRIGGDEFIAVIMDFSEEDMKEAFGRLDIEIQLANDALPAGAKVPVAFSRGAATFAPGEDTAFKMVFRRADKELYVNKAQHHKE